MELHRVTTASRLWRMRSYKFLLNYLFIPLIPPLQAPDTNGTLLPGGQITLGGKDTENCGGEWIRVGSANRENWSTMIHSTHIRLPSGEFFESQYDDQQIHAKISIASPLHQIPRELHWNLMKQQLNASFNYDLGLYTLPCYDLAKVPSIVINIGSGLDSIYYTVTAGQLIIRTKLTKTHAPVCALPIVPNVSDNWNNWVIGSHFLPKRCVHLDYANNWISFADPLERD